MALQYSDLSRQRQAFVRVCQRLNFGEIRNLRVRDAEPAFEPKTVILVDEKLDAGDPPRQELALNDFELPIELCRLMARLDAIGDGQIERVEVRAGLPRRLVFESRLPTLLALDTQT